MAAFWSQAVASQLAATVTGSAPPVTNPKKRPPVVAMVAARSAAMSFNRLADASIDAANPRTLARALPAGLLTQSFVRNFVVLSSGVFVLAGWELNRLAFMLSPLALGAAIQAAILSGEFKNVLLLDVTPLSLGLETFGGLMNVIIPRNSTIPIKAGEMFTTAVDQQRSMLLHVLQGERERAKDNWSLGRFTLEFEAAPRGAARVVQFEIVPMASRMLARDTKTARNYCGNEIGRRCG
jgi:hypothetical protein